jgi:hypothetical protein
MGVLDDKVVVMTGAGRGIGGATRTGGAAGAALDVEPDRTFVSVTDRIPEEELCPKADLALRLWVLIPRAPGDAK